MAILILLGTGCTGLLGAPTVTPLPDVPAWHLLLDTKAFPKDWEADPCTLSPDCFGENKAYRNFGIVGVPGNVLQNVLRYGDGEGAKAKFRVYREGAFRKSHNEPSTEYLPPPEITYRSPIADEYYLACGVDVIPACKAVFRYANYFVYFYFDIDEGKGNGLKIEQVEPILRAMDEKASSVLGIPLPKTP